MSPRRHILRALTPVELLAKVYRAEGWTRARGESRVRRVETLYTLAIEGHYFVARPKENPMPETTGEREARKRLSEHLDMIVILRSRVAIASELGIPDTVRGAEEDIRKRLREVERLRRGLGS